MVDWILNPRSNVHVAKHRDWFTKYTEFRTTVEAPGVEILEVYGIGNVQLKVRGNNLESGGKYHNLFLKDVLYAPSSITNVFASSTEEGIRVIYNGENGFIVDHGDRELLLDRPRTQKLWLVGQPKGQTSLPMNSELRAGATWSEEERSRWEAHERGPAPKAPTLDGIFIGGLEFGQDDRSGEIALAQAAAKLFESHCKSEAPIQNQSQSQSPSQNGVHIGKRKQKRLNREKREAESRLVTATPRPRRHG